MIEINDTIFLHSYEMFKKVILPNENKLREDKGMRPLTEEDEIINLFLELRKKYEITGDGIEP